MKTVMFASVVSTAVSVKGGTLDLSWEDCGDASTHGKISGIDKSSISLGEQTTVTGSGTVDEAISGGDFTITAKAGPITQNYQGKVCEAKEFDLPLGLGKVNWNGLSCPAAAGDLSVGVGVKLSAIIPSQYATADVTATATGASADDKLLCMTLHTSPAATEEQGNCDGAACPAVCDCAFSKCSSQVSACLGDSSCAAAQDCVLACACGDVACAAGCAAGAGSLATDVLSCVTSSCSGDSEVNGGTLNLSWEDCGDASTHGKISGIDKSSITLGEQTTVTGSGTVDEAISGGDFTITAKAGPITQNYQGKVCEAKEFDLPLGLGKVNWNGLSCPAAAGDLSVGVGVKLSAVIPSQYATADVTATATGASADDKLLCMTLHTSPAATEAVSV